MDYLGRAMPDASTLRSSKAIILSYILDYVVVVVLFLAISALNLIKPFNQHFALQNYSLQYPYAKHERVPDWLLYTCAVVAPLGIIAIWTLVLDPLLEKRRARKAGRPQDRYTKGLWELNCGVLGLLLANAVAYVVTGVLKNAIGKPRPDLIDRCQPELPQDPLDVISPIFGLSDSSICRQPNQSILNDGFRSFPSGHSSSSFAGLFYLSLYLAGKLHFLDHQGAVWKVFVVMIPTLGAALIAGSRIMDARHHPFDVITGSLLGILCAFVAYRQYFPAVTAFDRMGRAYTERRHHGPTGPEPVRSVHRPTPSFTFEPADTALDHSLLQDDAHGKSYTSLHGNDGSISGGATAAVTAAGINGGTPQRSHSQALASEPLRQPLRQRGISNPSDPRTSLGPEYGLNSAAIAASVAAAAAAAPARQYSPDPSFVSQQSSMFGRPSAEGPLGSENHASSTAWQQHQQQLQQQHGQLSPQQQFRGISPLRSPPMAATAAVPPGGHEPLIRHEFPGSPPPSMDNNHHHHHHQQHQYNRPASPVEMNPLPSPKGPASHSRAHSRAHSRSYSSHSNGRRSHSRNGSVSVGYGGGSSSGAVNVAAAMEHVPLPPPPPPPMSPQQHEQLHNPGSRYSFEEGGERLVHPAFRNGGG